MSSKLLSIKVFLTVCLLCLIGGGNSAWAQDTYTYTKVTSEDQLVAGGHYIIVNEDASVALGKQNNKNRAEFSNITFSNNETTIAKEDIATSSSHSKIFDLVLGGESGAWTFFDSCNNGYLYAASSSANQLKVQTAISNNCKASITLAANGNVTIKFLGTYTRNLLKYNSTSSLFSCYASGQDDVQLYVRTTPFTLTTAQYGTYFTTDAFVMPEGVTGYTITDKDGENLTLNEAYTAGTTVPASTALVLKATDELTESKTFNAVVVNSTETAPTDNLLHGTVEAAETNVEGATAYYKLANGDKGLGFYYGAENGGAFTNGAHKAYLAVKGNLSQMKGFSFDGMTTGINQISTAKANDNAHIYDLNGRRIKSLGAAQKGIYIVGGKKVIVK